MLYVLPRSDDLVITYNILFLGSAFNKLSLIKPEVDPTGQLTPPPSPENK